MYKKWVFSIILLTFPILVIANPSFGSDSDKPLEMTSQIDQTMRYTSAQFTQPELDEKHEIKQDALLDGYDKAAESEEMILYVNGDSLAIKLYNKKTGYMWDSGLDHPENYRLNKTWKQTVQSAITVEYTDRTGKLNTESILTNDSGANLKITDFGFTAKVSLVQAKLKFQMDVHLEGNELIISIPQKELKEDKRNKLVSMQIYPFLGAINENDIPGYMFIPDGSGALIRYEKSSHTSGAPFIGAIFGQDEGIKGKASTNNDVVPVQQVKMPVFGAVHGVKQNGFVAIVEDGYGFGDIVAYPAGVTTDFNRVSSVISLSI